MRTTEDEKYRLGFNDGYEGRDCKASSHEYLKGFKRGRELRDNLSIYAKSRIFNDESI